MQTPARDTDTMERFAADIVRLAKDGSDALDRCIDVAIKHSLDATRLTALVEEVERMSQWRLRR